MKMKIYIASTFESRAELRPIRDELHRLGHEVVSTWLDEPDGDGYTMSQAHLVALANRDLYEIAGVDLFILCTLFENNRGGREVEFGYALSNAGVVWIVGPERNIFHTLADQRFDNWTECFRAFGELVAMVTTRAITIGS